MFALQDVASGQSTPAAPTVPDDVEMRDAADIDHVSTTQQPPDLQQMTLMPPSSVASDIEHQSRISAYARLDFASFTFYVQTLQVVMGRRVDSAGAAASSDTLTPNRSRSRTPSRQDANTPGAANNQVSASNTPGATATVAGTSGGNGSIDVHLGTAKAISRRHAKIFYNFANQRFEFSVLGRNGAFVDDVFVEKGSTVPLNHGYVC